MFISHCLLIFFPSKSKSRSMLHHRSVGASLKQNKRNLTLPLTFHYLLLLSIIKLCLYHNFYGFFIFTAYLRLIRRQLCEEAMSVRLRGTIIGRKDMVRNTAFLRVRMFTSWKLVKIGLNKTSAKYSRVTTGVRFYAKPGSRYCQDS